MHTLVLTMKLCGMLCKRVFQNCVSGLHPFWVSDKNRVSEHEGGAFKQKIKFLADLVVMALGRLSKVHRSFGQALHLNGRVGAIKNAADDGAVFGNEMFLDFRLANNHVLNLCDFIMQHRLNRPIN